MNKLIALIILGSSLNAFAAKSVKLNCGPQAGYDVIVEITKNTGDTQGGHAEYVGTYTGPGKDSTTGTFLRSTRKEIAGYKENVPGFGKAYFLSNLQSGLALVVEDISFKKGTEVKVVRVDARTTQEESLVCKVQ